MRLIILIGLILVIVILVIYIIKRYYHRKLQKTLHQTYPTSQRTLEPNSRQALQQILKSTPRVSIRGMGRSQGGQTFHPTALTLDLGTMNGILDFTDETITVEAGATWNHVLKFMSPYGRSIGAMQSYSDFSIGGSIGVNAHGQDLHWNPVSSCLEQMTVLMPTGHLRTLTPRDRLSRYIIGGYGLCGIILDATFRHVPNVQMRKTVQVVSLDDYLDLLQDHVTGDQSRLHSARLDLPTMEHCLVVEYESTGQIVNELLHQESGFVQDGDGLALMANYPSLRQFRLLLETSMEQSDIVTTRNHVLSARTSSLNSSLYPTSNFILQEYFVPLSSRQNITDFIADLRHLVAKYNINLVNVTLRYVRAHSTILSYARHNSLALVLYLDLNKFQPLDHCQEWTREVIDRVMAYAGTYYLPYHLFARPDQFRQCYPGWRKWLTMKRAVDPDNRLTSHLGEYLTASSSVVEP
jgi:decaprenylphospho-beta-D-ribofuranose 2-oxidase